MKKKSIFKSSVITLSAGAFILFGSNEVNAEVKDMNQSHWGKETVENAIKEGWVEDYQFFNPSQPIKRLDAAFYLGGALKEPQVPYQPKFKDVNKNSTQYIYLPSLVKKEIFMDSEYFYPNNNLTRAQAAKIIVKAFDLKGSSKANFKDVKPNSWYEEYVKTLVANGITKGRTPNTFGPNDEVTRVQFVAFLERALKAKSIKEHDINKMDLSPEMFQAIMQNNMNLNGVTVKKKARSEEQIMKAIKDAYTHLYKEVELDTIYSIKEIKNFIYQWEQNNYPRNNINNMTLAKYDAVMKKGKIYIIDNSNSHYNAKDIEVGVKKFAEEFKKRSKAKTDKEKLLEAYDYIYENYTYSATNTKEMLVGNMGLNTLACNGFSRLLHELVTEIGLTSEIVRGDSHIWNQVIVDGEKINVDVTTDVYLQKKYLTLGMNSKEHINVGNEVRIYGMTFNSGPYKEITQSKKDLFNE